MYKRNSFNSLKCLQKEIHTNKINLQIKLFFLIKKKLYIKTNVNWKKLQQINSYDITEFPHSLLLYRETFNTHTKLQVSKIIIKLY